MDSTTVEIFASVSAGVFSYVIGYIAGSRARRKQYDPYMRTITRKALRLCHAADSELSSTLAIDLLETIRAMSTRTAIPEHCREE